MKPSTLRNPIPILFRQQVKRRILQHPIRREQKSGGDDHEAGILTRRRRCEERETQRGQGRRERQGGEGNRRVINIKVGDAPTGPDRRTRAATSPIVGGPGRGGEGGGGGGWRAGAGERGKMEVGRRVEGARGRGRG